MVDCANCIEKCPQAAAANEIAKGRMFAEREFIDLINKIENGTLLEVVRCKECKWFCTDGDNNGSCGWRSIPGGVSGEWYCADGERKGGDE